MLGHNKYGNNLYANVAAALKKLLHISGSANAESALEGTLKVRKKHCKCKCDEHCGCLRSKFWCLFWFFYWKKRRGKKWKWSLPKSLRRYKRKHKSCAEEADKIMRMAHDFRDKEICK